MKKIKRAVAWALRLKPCSCGCNLVYIGKPTNAWDRPTKDFSDLSRIGKWATRDASGG